MVKSWLPEKPLRGRVHRRDVERARHAPDAAALERKIGPAVDDAIEIVPPGRRKARIEIVGDPFGRQHRDRMRPQIER